MFTAVQNENAPIPSEIVVTNTEKYDDRILPGNLQIIIIPNNRSQICSGVLNFRALVGPTFSDQ